MKITKTKKIIIISLGVVVATGTTIGVVLGIKKATPEKNKKSAVVASNQLEIVKPLTAVQLINKILKGELDLLDLKVKDFVKVIEALKSDQPNQLKVLLADSAPGILEKIKTIDTKTFHLAFDLILNKGLLNLSQANIFEVEKVIKLFIKKQAAPWWLEFIKYIPVILHEGLNKLFSENSKAFFDYLTPQLVNLVAEKNITKLDSETATQQQARAKQVAILEVKLMTITKALLANSNHAFFQDFVPQFANLGAKKIIEQLPAKTVAQQQARQKKEVELQTDITSMAHHLFRDHTNEVFNKIMPQIVNRVVQKVIIKPDGETIAQQKARAIKAAALQKDLLKLARKFLINGFSSKDEMATDVTNLIYQVTNKIPKVHKEGPINIDVQLKIKAIILNIVKALTIPSKEHVEMKMNNASQNLKNLEEDNIALAQAIGSLATKITTTTKAKGNLESTYKDLKVKLGAFQASKPYDALMLQLGINTDALKDVNKFNKDNEGNHFLSDKWYEDEYKAYWVLARSLWDNQSLSKNDKPKIETREDWYEKMEEMWKAGVTKNGGASNRPNHNKIIRIIENVYGAKILESLASKWNKIQEENHQKLIKENQETAITIPPFASDIPKIQQYENMPKQLSDMQSLKVEKATIIQNNQVKITSLKLEMEALKNSLAYGYEIKHKITREILNKNEFFNGQGFLKLSQNDVSNLLYKVQDLLLNAKIYLDSALGKVPFSEFGFAASVIRPIFKQKVDEFLNPLLEKHPAPELMTKIKMIDAEKISQALDGIISKGLAKTDNVHLLALMLLIKKFTTIKLIDQNLWNIILLAKKGLNVLPKPSKAATLFAIIDLIKMPDTTAFLIKSYIIKEIPKEIPQKSLIKE